MIRKILGASLLQVAMCSTVRSSRSRLLLPGGLEGGQSQSLVPAAEL